MTTEGKKEESHNLDASHVAIEVEVLAFADLLMKIVKSDLKNYSGITLNSEKIAIVLKILESSPSYFSDVEKLFVEIIKDNKIDARDVPKFIVLTQKLYELIYNFKDKKLDSKKRCEVCASILKFVIYVLVEEKKIAVDDAHKTEFLSETDKLIDSFIALVRLPKKLKTNNCLQALFGKK